MGVVISKEKLLPLLIYNKPINYNNHVILYPVTMENYILFQFLSNSITVRKNSKFRDKNIIKMTYLDFLIYSLGNKELEEKYGISDLSYYFVYAVELLELCCRTKINIDKDTAQLYINDCLVTPEIFDDLRRIIIIQNDIDFDIDEFINYDTEQALLKAQEQINKDKSGIEDYIDSLVIAMNVTETDVMNMTIRKFWRYIKRYQLHEQYGFAKTGEYSGMVSFKEPIKHWMVSFDEDEKYKHVTIDEKELKSKISQANG